MRLKAQRQAWDGWSRREPLWAILTDPRLRSGEWGIEDFLRTGQDQVTEVLSSVERLGGIARDRALDFGCGVGRCTLPLAAQFTEVIGIDISPSMIGQATELATSRKVSNVTYQVSEDGRLPAVGSGSIDLAYCNIVLQHMEPRQGKRVIGELARVLTPGGIVVLQFPTTYPPAAAGTLATVKRRARIALPDPVVRCYDALHRRLRPTGVPPMEMHVYREADVVGVLASNGVKVLSAEHDGSLEGGWSLRRLFGQREVKLGQ
jgi:ubiquinone/menaquinone biosynthesis C-methylase UbiE